MIKQETHNSAHDSIEPHKEDTYWIVADVIVSLTLVAIVYFSLTLYPAF